ncbi:MAG: hypothetical protein ALAOOOJD_03003 [bacterium]|nr:hypothetical protein [bacterium]
MKGRKAGFIFLGVCVILAALLFAKAISPLQSGTIFAIALVLLGGFSGGFRK